jgi:signal peptidase II
METYTFRREMRPRPWITVLCLASIAGLVAIDQAVKQFIAANFEGRDIPLLGDFMHICYVRNTGAAFSILEGRTVLLAVITAIMIIACIVLLIRGLPRGGVGKAALVLIAAGGIGNLIDRIARGYVVDYLYPKFINFAIFNIADCCVVIGAIIICVYLILNEKNAKSRTGF